MAHRNLEFQVTFEDFRFLQGYMARRVYAKNKAAHTRALFGVVLCAVFLALAIIVNLYPGVAVGFLGARYPLSVLLAIILCLCAAIIALLPAVRLRLASLRMQVSDNGPILGPTRLVLEEDGLIFDRALVTSKYRYAALQPVELSKNAVIVPIDNGIGLIIPNTAFTTEAVRYEFVADLAKRIEESWKA